MSLKHNIYYMGFIAKLFLTCLLIITISTKSCGGNCPSSNCDDCPCGTTPSLIDTDAYCKLMKGDTQADINCCKCIISHTSKGNQKFSDEKFLRVIGVIPYPQQGAYLCPLDNLEDLCTWKGNAKCVNRIYREYNAWWIWEQAKICGCPYDPYDMKKLQTV